MLDDKIAQAKENKQKARQNNCGIDVVLFHCPKLMVSPFL